MPDLTRLPTFDDDGSLHVVIEAPRGSGLKLKFEPKLQAFTVSRALPVGLTYPFDWGFVPSTKAPDGDPLDALVLQDVPSYPGVVVPCRVIGAVKVDQKAEKGGGRERNDRLIAVPRFTQRLGDVKSVKGLNDALRDEICEFFLNTTFQTGKDARIRGWMEAPEALRLAKACAKAFSR